MVVLLFIVCLKEVWRRSCTSFNFLDSSISWSVKVDFFENSYLCQKADMYIYNITVAVDPSIEQEWLLWSRQVWIPQLYERGKFQKIESFLVESSAQELISFAFHCTASLEQLEHYQKNHQREMQELLWHKFAEKALSFSTRLRMIV